MKAIISIGISGSGKTTEFSKREYDGYVKIERDIMRKRLLNFPDDSSDNFWSIWKFTKENEKKVTAMVNEIIADCATQKADIIIGDTNLNKKYRDILIAKLEALGYTVELKVFDIDVMEAIKRDELRRDTVGHQVVWKQYEQFKEQFPEKQYVPDESKTKCILVDVDGTLAHANGKRGMFEWHRVGVDDCDEMVRAVVVSVAKTPFIHPFNEKVHVIILSGRDGICRQETTDWLDSKAMPFDKLIMRAPGDMRKDTVVKKEIFWRDIADNYNVMFAIDDRPGVCDAWRAIGLKVFQVGNPNIRF